MKKVLILTGKATTITKALQPVLDRIAELHPDNDIEFTTGTFADLDFYIDGPNTHVSLHPTGADLADFDLVVFRTISDLKEEAMATATYLKQKGVKFFDRNYPRVWGRIGQSFERWAADIASPRTAAGTAAGLIAVLPQIGIPAVLKATNSRKGRDNYLIHDATELQRILESNPDTKYVLQQFIPNDGDYRVLVLDFDRVVLTLRKGQGDTHLNNVSAGGSETLITDYSDLAPVIDLARRCAKLDELSLAGVDVIVDRDTGAPYILEVNRAPQCTLDAEIDGFYQVIISELDS